jgi:hypothetical protein
MKPLSQISRQPRLHRGEEAPIAVRAPHPVTDHQYHANGGVLRAASARLKLAPSFRDLSSEFLATEMKRDYAAEAAFFAIIVGVSVWPIVSTFQALAQLVK